MVASTVRRPPDINPSTGPRRTARDGTERHIAYAARRSGGETVTLGPVERAARRLVRAAYNDRPVVVAAGGAVHASATIPLPEVAERSLGHPDDRLHANPKAKPGR